VININRISTRSRLQGDIIIMCGWFVIDRERRVASASVGMVVEAE
jgi:hypothetical protein